MEKIRAIIVDDEADGRDALALAIARFTPEIKVVASCASPEEAMEMIGYHRPALVFMDIHMPGMSGFDLLERLQPIDFEIVFVSAYDRFALRAIKFSALDYLLKPVDPDELKVSVERMKQRLQKMPERMTAYSSVLHNIRFRDQGTRRIAVPGMTGISFFDADDIVFMKADGSYTRLIMRSGTQEVVSRNLKDFENLLCDSEFCRVHHSFLINLKHVQHYLKGEGGTVVLTGNHRIDISRRKKNEFLKLMNIR